MIIIKILSPYMVYHDNRGITTSCIIYDQILENSSKSHIKYAVFHHLFNVISVNAYVFIEYFLKFKP